MTLRVSTEGHVRTLELDRPEKRNALNRQLMSALNDALNDIEGDPAVRAVVIVGRGPLFSAGADINDLADLSPADAKDHMRWGQAIFDRIEDLRMPVIAAINGHAFGGGLELALACDLRYVAATALLAQKEVTLENLPGWGGTQRLPRLIGEARAKEMIYLGSTVDAEEALAFGLVNGIEPVESLRDAVSVTAASLASRSPVALTGAKVAIASSRRPDRTAGMVIEAEGVSKCFETDAQQAALNRFLGRSADG